MSWRDPEQAAVGTLSTTGSALLGSALTTALGIGVLIASPLVAIPAVRHHGGNHDCLLAASFHPGSPAGDGDLGLVPSVRLRLSLRSMAADLDQEIEAVFQRQGQR